MPHTLTPVLVPLIITLIISSLAAMLAFKAPKSREKASPYECGFDPKNSARTPFSNRFFMIAVLFLIFDIEIVILLPLPLFSTLGPLVKFTSLIILVILLIGTLHEMRQGALDWKDAH